MTCRAVLDACLSPTDEPDEYRFYYRILESDGNGLAPSDPGFNANGKTVFHRVLEAKDKVRRIDMMKQTKTRCLRVSTLLCN